LQSISASIEGSLPEHTERWQAENRESVVKDWEIIADNLHDAGWSLGWVSALDLEGRTIWIVDAHGYGKRFIVHADENTACISRSGTGDSRVHGEFDLVMAAQTAGR